MAFESLAYALLRIFSGFLFACFGAQKLFGWPVERAAELDTLTTIGGVIELVGGLLVTFGFATRLAAFVCSGTMAVAYWQFHGLRSGQPLPIQNGGVPAVLFCFVFFYVFAYGSGRLSLDRAIRRRQDR